MRVHEATSHCRSYGLRGVNVGDLRDSAAGGAVGGVEGGRGSVVGVRGGGIGRLGVAVQVSVAK